MGKKLNFVYFWSLILVNEGDKNENVITKKFSDEGIVTSNYASTGKSFNPEWLTLDPG